MTDYKVTSGQDNLLAAIAEITAGTGPIAIDVERASGYRYSQRAYLIQIFRQGSGFFLIDPTTINDFTPLATALADIEWIFHAASQDLPSLREIGLNPKLIFDTELAARLLGYEKVGLQTILEAKLEIQLTKAHSAADWSTRPLPQDWLKYAADDVLYLIPLAAKLKAELAQQNKTEIANQEFEATLKREPKAPMPQPWRRLSGLHSLRSARQLAIARELWLTRESFAAQSDIAPGRLVPDRALIAAASTDIKSKDQLLKLKEFNGRAAHTEIDRWWKAIETGRNTQDLPERKGPANGPGHPPVKAWPERYPLAAQRLKLSRQKLEIIAEEHNIPVENLLTPQILRTMCWSHAEEIQIDELSRTLSSLGARPWQIELCLDAIGTAFAEASEEHPHSEQE